MLEVALTEKMQLSHKKEDDLFVITLSHGDDDDELFKSDLLNFIEKVEFYRPKKDLWDLRGFCLTIDVELQAWVDENINNKALQLGVDTVAFVLPNSFIEQLAVEQTMEEKHGAKLTTKYFSDYDAALNWINS